MCVSHSDLWVQTCQWLSTTRESRIGGRESDESKIERKEEEDVKRSEWSGICIKGREMEMRNDSLH